MRVFLIPAHQRFLPALAEGLLAQVPADDPAALATYTLLLPTRRAARALREAFLTAAGGRALLLPRMRALPGLSVEEADELALPALLDLPPAVPPLTRQAVLSRIVLGIPRRYGGPLGAEQAWLLAGELATLFDEIAFEEADLDLIETADPADFAASWLARLDGLVPDKLAVHWQITTRLLQAVVHDWNQWLQAQRLMDLGLARVRALIAQRRALEAAPPREKLIAAGIGAGGTIPAATALLRCIASLPNGALVLQGMAEPITPSLADAIRRAPSHPFAGQLKLLSDLGVEPNALRPWTAADHHVAPADRAVMLARSLRPAEGLALWAERDAPRWQAALAGITRLTAADAQQEAAAIALLLREAVELPGKRAALITPDRDLARRVSAELARHGITADDSAGAPLADAPAAAFLSLIVRMIADGFAPAALLAVLKHPLCTAGMERGVWLDAVRGLERKCLRGPRPAAGLPALRAALPAGDTVLVGLVDALQAALGDFTELPPSPSRPPAALLALHLAAAEALAATPELPGGIRLYVGEEGEALARHLASLGEALAEMPPIGPASWPGAFDAMLAGPIAPPFRAQRDTAAHPRIAILGLLEARLQSFDRVVLGALEENIWPQATEPGPWMSRPMRARFGLPAPEARIGRVAADFFHAAASASELVLSTARKRGGAPSVPTRWLTRLETFLKGQGEIAIPTSAAARWAAALDQPEDGARPWGRPAPRPPIEVRPRRLSVSDATQLIADPYAFYAARILRLRPLDELDADIGAREYGTLVHHAMRFFLTGLGTGWPGTEAARALWDLACKEALQKEAVHPGVLAFWGPRMARMGEFVIAEEEKLRAQNGLLRCLTEHEGRVLLTLAGGEVEILAKADRLDEVSGGGWRILDYKTGQVPGATQVVAGAAPQLALEAMILEAGGYPTISADAKAAALVYWKLSGGEKPGEEKNLGASADDGTLYADLARTRIVDLAQRMLLGDAPFESRPHPARGTPGDDYDHLARVDEWASGDGDGI
ncbi:MAG: double-strand break repair protein AddB [Roseomonas sp.]|nr:double-strand break repair protein AddB [Roseomonas sp.]MCA3291842.1 double-strand break repair protein AddB [Roseomonas sp.]MCA3293932.1 double-strand break repair protein AddB [Roseomonas sp.]